MNHIQIIIEANEEQQEILISELSELDAMGFEQTATHLLAYFDEDDFTSYEVNKLLKDYVSLHNSLKNKTGTKYGKAILNLLL